MIIFLFVLLKRHWLSGTEFASQCRRCKGCGFDPWVRRSPGGGNGNPLQYSCLQNPMDGGAWRATAHGVSMSWTQLSVQTHTNQITTTLLGDSMDATLTPGMLSSPRRERIPPLELGGGNGSPLDEGGTLVLPTSGDGYVGELLELQQGCEGPFGSPEVRCD